MNSNHTISDRAESMSFCPIPYESELVVGQTRLESIQDIAVNLQHQNDIHSFVIMDDRWGLFYSNVPEGLDTVHAQSHLELHFEEYVLTDIRGGYSGNEVYPLSEAIESLGPPDQYYADIWHDIEPDETEACDVLESDPYGYRGDGLLAWLVYTDLGIALGVRKDSIYETLICPEMIVVTFHCSSNSTPELLEKINPISEPQYLKPWQGYGNYYWTESFHEDR